MTKFVMVSRNVLIVPLLLVLIWLSLGCGTSAEPAPDRVGANPAARSTDPETSPTRMEPVVVPDKAATKPVATPDNAAAEPVAALDKAATEPVAAPDNAAAEPVAAPNNAAAEPVATPKKPVVAPDTRPDAPPVGTRVGNHIPSFAMTLVDGTQVDSAELLKEGQPTFLITFTTW